MTTRAHSSGDLERQVLAAEWLLRLKDPALDEEAVAEWIAWSESDPRNRKAFEGMAEVHEIAGRLDRETLDGAARPVAGLRRGAPAGPQRARRWAWASAAIAASIVVGVTLALAPPLARVGSTRGGLPPASTSRLETARGVQKTVRLDDGSQVQLGGRSALSVRYSPETRLIVADSGEAFFKVAHNRERPFVVEAGPVTITAVGTAFSVEREGNAVAVTVTEGAVEVRAAPSLKSDSDRADNPATPAVVLRISAGHRVRFDRGELTQSVERIDPGFAAAWGTGRLEFKDEPLRLVVARINRYSPRQIQISDPSIEDLRVTGTVYSDRIDAWLEGVEVVLPVRVRRVAENRVELTPAIGAPARTGR